VADAVNLPLISAKERGAGGGHIRFNMARGSMNSHISQFPVGTYKKGHGAWPGRARDHPVGRGLFADVAGRRRAAPLRLGGRQLDRAAEHVAAPAFQHRHQPARYLAFKHEVVSIRNAQGVPKAWNQPAARRRPDRLCRRNAVGAHDVRE